MLSILSNHSHVKQACSTNKHTKLTVENEYHFDTLSRIDFVTELNIFT